MSAGNWYGILVELCECSPLAPGVLRMMMPWMKIDLPPPLFAVVAAFLPHFPCSRVLQGSFALKNPALQVVCAYVCACARAWIKLAKLLQGELPRCTCIKLLSRCKA